MRVTDLHTQPFHFTPFLNAGRNGGTVRERLPWLRGTIGSLPDSLDALLITSDLQGRGIAPQQPLLGEVVAAEYTEHFARWNLPAPGRVGVLLPGDYFAAPAADKRGATGDVEAVWQAFARAFGSVTGVLGNHDTLRGQPPGSLLDGTSADFAGLRVAGVGGIVGNPRRHARREWPEYVKQISCALDGNPHILLLHVPPAVSETQPGEDGLTNLLDGLNLLTCCGHVHWHEPLAELPGGGQVLNVDSCVVVLTRQASSQTPPFDASRTCPAALS